jgi:hypothetical protein
MISMMIFIILFIGTYYLGTVVINAVDNGMSSALQYQPGEASVQIQTYSNFGLAIVIGLAGSLGFLFLASWRREPDTGRE